MKRGLVLVLLCASCLLIPSVSFEQGACYPSATTGILECAKPSPSSGSVTHTGPLTTDQPVFGNGTTDVKVGTKSGNTNKVVTMGAGDPALNDCAKFDADDNLVSAGAECGSGGSGVPAGSPGDLQYNNSGSLGGTTFVPRANGGVCDASVTTMTGAAIQSAIDALSVKGGDVCLIEGTYVVTTALTIGNGTNGTPSTSANVRIHGLGANTTFSGGPAHKTILDCTGTADGNCFVVRGSLYGWGLDHFAMTGVDTESSSVGLLVTSGQGGAVKNLVISGFKYGYYNTTRTTDVALNQSSQFNIHEDMLIVNGTNTADKGIYLTGIGSNNNSYNTFRDARVVLGANSQDCLYLGWADRNYFFNSACFTSDPEFTGTIGVHLDYTSGSAAPYNNYFYNPEFFLIATAFVNISTPPADAIFNNYLWSMGTDNSEVIPNIAGLQVWGASDNYIGAADKQFVLRGKLTGYANTAPTDGQLLVGKTSTGTFETATITAGDNITVFNGPGTITLASTAVSAPAGAVGDIQYNNSGSFGGRTLIPRANGGVCDAYLAPGTNTLHTAVAALTTGQVLCLGVGTYTQTGANVVVVGDGSPSQLSTKGGITIRGASAPANYAHLHNGENGWTDYGYLGPTVIDCTGTTSGNCLAVHGPVDGITIEDLTLLGSGSVAFSTGLSLTSSQNGTYKRLAIHGFNVGALFTSVTTPSFAGDFDSIHNVFADSTINNASGSNTGLLMNGSSDIGNADFNEISNITIGHVGTNGEQCIYLGWTDNNHLKNIHCTNWTGIGLTLDYSVYSGTRGPYNNYFYGLELGLGTVTVTGTAPAVFANYVFGFSTANSNVCPNVGPALIVFGCSYQHAATEVTHSTSQAIADGTPVVLAFDTEIRKVIDGSHSTTVTNSHLIAVRAGEHEIECSLQLAVGTPTSAYIQIRKNGTVAMAIGNVVVGVADTGYGQVHRTAYLALDDYVECLVGQTGGTGVVVPATAQFSPIFTMNWTGP